MHLAVINVEVEGAVRGEDPVGLAQPRLEELQVVVKAVGVGARAHLDRVVALSLEAHAVTGDTAHGLDARARLGPARIEGRIDVDEGSRAVRHVAAKDLQIVAEVDSVHSPGSIEGEPGEHRILAGARPR